MTGHHAFFKTVAPVLEEDSSQSRSARWMTRYRDRYGLVLIATFFTLIVIAVLGDMQTGMVLGPVLLSLVFALTVAV